MDAETSAIRTALTQLAYWESEDSVREARKEVAALKARNAEMLGALVEIRRHLDIAYNTAWSGQWDEAIGDATMVVDAALAAEKGENDGD